MTFFKQILNVPFAQFWLEHPFLAALAVFCCVFLLSAGSAILLARRPRPARIHEVHLLDPPPSQDDVILVQPDDEVSQNVTTGGMALELPFPLKVRTRLHLRGSEAKLSGASFVRR